VTEVDQLKNIRSGDDKALREVYLKYKPEFLVWIGKLAGLSADDALEVYHLTMITFYENVKGGKLTTLTSQLKTYIFGIGKNKAKEFKRLYQTKNVSLDTNQMNFAVNVVPQEEINKDLIAPLKKGLRHLGDPCKSLLEAFYLDGLSMEEISKVFEYKSASVAKTQKYKCIQRLKKIIAKF